MVGDMLGGIAAIVWWTVVGPQYVWFEYLMRWRKPPKPEMQPGLTLPVLQDIDEFHHDRYQYSALPGRRHIRVLVVEPSPLADPIIRTCIETASLDAKPEYAALSYSWGMNIDGDATPNRTILVHGSPLLVTQNLFEGLLRLRPPPPEQPLRIWIDAVCIDQKNERERTKQVAIMASIYTCATRLIIWLGEGASFEEDQIASEALVDYQWYRYARRFRNCFAFRWHRKAIHDSLKPLRKRRYFTRRWVVQEILHSDEKKALVYWGHCACCLTRMRTEFQSLYDSYKAPLHKLREKHLLFSIGRPRAVGSSDSDLLALLQENHGLECSDDRDRLYSLTSLAKDIHVEADYTISTEQVYTGFALHLVATGRSDILFHTAVARHAMQASVESSDALRLPIWTPDLRHDSVAGSMNRKYDIGFPRLVEGGAEGVLMYTPLYLGRVSRVNKRLTSVTIGLYNSSPLKRARSNGKTRPSHRVCILKERRADHEPVLLDQHINLLSRDDKQPFPVLGHVQKGDIICAIGHHPVYTAESNLDQVYVLRKVNKEDQSATPACRFVAFGHGSREWSRMFRLYGFRNYNDELKEIEVRLGMDYAYPTLPTD